jgi:hypothetical protein
MVIKIDIMAFRIKKMQLNTIYLAFAWNAIITCIYNDYF